MWWRGKLRGKRIGNERWRGKEWVRQWLRPRVPQLDAGVRVVSAKSGGAYRGFCRTQRHGALSATKSLIAFLPASSSLMSSLISVLKAKLADYMLSLPDGAAEYEDYEVWGQGFAKRVAVFDRSARGQDVPVMITFCRALTAVEAYTKVQILTLVIHSQRITLSLVEYHGPIVLAGMERRLINYSHAGHEPPSLSWPEGDQRRSTRVVVIERDDLENTYRYIFGILTPYFPK
ncbi:hypothetical protein HETIRDRAFT_426649 [Heterobasidion irregulare TC 32-1]|uniref:Uncharacterized protein n=1 Tax=Heterobasidion irregulare (strain TC 32-1) TaxID=747525 RepID=W4KE91_HETIT|nr:uncharacterized protein HETIRDRAFT_426649 [Heterobasidion irregulare TC 32-1]ETW83366.1 hypothetical protein HETIRDRAFT_426649 [Heterobasidion irregulare TC 32-1]